MSRDATCICLGRGGCDDQAPAVPAFQRPRLSPGRSWRPRDLIGGSGAGHGRRDGHSSSRPRPRGHCRARGSPTCRSLGSRRRPGSLGRRELIAAPGGRLHLLCRGVPGVRAEPLSAPILSAALVSPRSPCHAHSRAAAILPGGLRAQPMPKGRSSSGRRQPCLANALDQTLLDPPARHLGCGQATTLETSRHVDGMVVTYAREHRRLALRSRTRYRPVSVENATRSRPRDRSR